MNKILLTVRSKSTRLKNKAHIKLNNNITTIEYLIDRLKHCNYDIILCTTINKEDNILEEIAHTNNIKCFRGSENDKLQRWYDCCKYYKIKNIVTVDGDDLFCEPELINIAFKQIEKNNCDFIKGDHTELICGAFTYCFTFNALERVINLKNDLNTEMMWVYFTDTGIFNIEELQNINTKYYRDDIRMTLDYQEDLDFFNKIIDLYESNNLYKSNSKYLNLETIIDIINKNPEIKNINLFRKQDWKLNQEKNIKLVTKNSKKFIGNEIKYMNEILNNNNLSCKNGSWTKTLEKEFANKMDCEYGIAFNSGTSTMHAALLAVGVKPGDEVISPALTVIMNTTTTIHSNAIPVYVDINPETFCIDPKKIEEKITDKTKAIFIVNIYGLPCDLDEILEISKKYNIPVIEDNAECVLSYYKGKIVGSMCDMSSYSFENSKHISCGEGGMLISNNEKYAEYSRKVGSHGFQTLKADNGVVKLNRDVWQNPNFERHDEIGYNYRLPEINSAIAYAQFERIEEIVNLRIKSAEYFLEIIKNCDYLIPQKTPPDRTNTYWALGIIYEGEKYMNVSWYDFRQKYIEMGGDGFYGAWKVPYLEPVMKNRNFVKCNPEIYKNIHYNEGLCPIAEELQKKLMIFKTSYRNLDLAKYKAYCLKKTILYFNDLKK